MKSLSKTGIFLLCHLIVLTVGMAGDWKAAFLKSGFDPEAEGSSVFVITSDVHIGMWADHFPAQIEEWNAMKPAPQFVGITGDLVTSVSSSFGTIPSEGAREKARKEIQEFRDLIGRLNKEIPLKLTFGNHDTYPGEIDAPFFRSVWPEIVPYYAFQDAGIYYQVWNGGTDGALDLKQKEWILQESAKVPSGASLVIFAHQPSLGTTVRERGIPEMVNRAFATHRGPLWMMSGHNHANRVAVFSLPETKIVEVTHARSYDGYWIYGVRDGGIVARVWKGVDGSCEAVKLPDLANYPAPPIPFAFEKQDGLLWSLLIGDDQEATDATFVHADAKFTGSWWAYVKELVVRLPLKEEAAGASKFIVLATIPAHPQTGKRATIWLSGDGEKWMQASFEEKEKGEYVGEIPTELRKSSELYVKILRRPDEGAAFVGGYALCR